MSAVFLSVWASALRPAPPPASRRHVSTRRQLLQRSAATTTAGLGLPLTAGLGLPLAAYADACETNAAACELTIPQQTLLAELATSPVPGSSFACLVVVVVVVAVPDAVAVIIAVLVVDDVFNDDDDGIDVRNQARLLPFSFSMSSFREVPDDGEGDDDDDDDDAGCWRTSRRR